MNDTRKQGKERDEDSRMSVTGGRSVYTEAHFLLPSTPFPQPCSQDTDTTPASCICVSCVRGDGREQKKEERTKGTSDLLRHGLSYQIPGPRVPFVCACFWCVLVPGLSFLPYVVRRSGQRDLKSMPDGCSKRRTLGKTWSKARSSGSGSLLGTNLPK